MKTNNTNNRTRKNAVKFFIAAIAAVVFIPNLNAKAHMWGTVINQTGNEPLYYANVALLAADSTIITGVASDWEGDFVLENIAEGDYLLQVSFIGYRTECYPVRMAGEVFLGEISLKENAYALAEVVISGKSNTQTVETEEVVILGEGVSIESRLNHIAAKNFERAIRNLRAKADPAQSESKDMGEYIVLVSVR